MSHRLCRVTGFEHPGPGTLRVRVDDDTEQLIDFRPVLRGSLYGPLRDAELFRQVSIDPEAHTPVWPNGADFGPATLHDWQVSGEAFIGSARRWETLSAESQRIA